MAGTLTSTAAWEHRSWQAEGCQGAGYQNLKQEHRLDFRPASVQEQAVQETGLVVSAGAGQVGRAYCPACSRFESACQCMVL